MSDMQPASIPLKLSVDEASLARSQAGVALLSQKLQDLRKNATDTGVTVDSAARALGDGVAKATPLMDRLSQAAEKAAQSARSAKGDWNDLRDSIFSAGDAADKAQGNFSGGIQGLRRTGGALSQLGLGVIGGPVSQIGDIAQVGKELQLVTQNLTAMSGATQPLIAGLSAGTVALGAVAAAGAVLVGGLALIRAGFTDLDRGMGEALSRLDTYYQALASGDAKTIEAKKKELETKQKYDEQELAFLVAAREKGFEEMQKQFGGDAAARLRTLLAGMGIYGTAATDLNAAIEKLTASTTANKGQIEGLTDAYNSQEIQAQILAEGVLANAEAVKQKVAQDQADAALTVEGVKNKIKAQQDLLAQDQAEYAALAASGDTSQKVKDRMLELAGEMGDLVTEIGKLSTTTLDAAKHTQELTDKTKAADQALQDRSKAMDEAQKVEDKRLSDIATSYSKYQNDIASITQGEAEKEAEIHKQLADKLVDEATKMAQEAADALQKLGDKRGELLINLQRGEHDAQSKAAYDELTAQIHSQEATQKAYQDHLDRLKDIQRGAWADEQQALLDRNFVALAKSRLNVVTQIQGENINFGRSERDRIAQEQSSRQDAQRQQAFEHQQRLVAYQRANEDAVSQYNIELRNQKIAESRAIQQAELAAGRELQVSAQKAQAALQLRRQSELAELKILQLGGEARVKAEAAIQQALVSQAMQFVGRFGGERSSAYGGIQSSGIYAPATSRNTSVQLQQTMHFPSGITDSTTLAQMVRSQTLSVLKTVLV